MASESSKDVRKDLRLLNCVSLDWMRSLHYGHRDWSKIVWIATSVCSNGILFT